MFKGTFSWKCRCDLLRVGGFSRHAEITIEPPPKVDELATLRAKRRGVRVFAVESLVTSRALHNGKHAAGCRAEAPGISQLLSGSVPIRHYTGRKLERVTGLEPATSSLGSWHSTTELHPHCGLNMGYGAVSVNLPRRGLVVHPEFRPQGLPHSGLRLAHDADFKAWLHLLDAGHEQQAELGRIFHDHNAAGGRKIYL